LAEEIFAALAAEVKGQEAACRVVAETVAVFKAGLNDPLRPLGVMLFCGPTGVGKTQLARSLAHFCFGHGAEKERLVRVDMSELGAPGAATRLLGDARGEPSELVRRVRAQPFLVVLLDEVEKAAPEVFDILLNLLDEGRLTDKSGRLTHFNSTFIVMTTNLGAAERGALGFGERWPTAPSSADLLSFFRPELYNRIDEIVQFAPLDRSAILAITKKELDAVVSRDGNLRRAIALEYDDAVVAWLADRGFDPRYGARELQRTIEAEVVTGIARLLAAEPSACKLTLRLSVKPQGGIAIERV
jgi:ATP-dependent Clp protease ATP-binding subunit ClpC